jgi:hypothetical protein
MKQPRPMFRGRELSDDQLAAIKAHVESFETIDAIDDDVRELIASQWPELLSKLVPAKKN